MPESGVLSTRVPRLTVTRFDRGTPCIDMPYAPMLCVVLSGVKRTDGAHADLRAGDLLVNLATAPVAAVLEPPYLSVTMTIDLGRVRALLPDVPRPAARIPARPAHADIGRADDELLEAFSRWLRLHETPEDIPALAGRHEDEILYRVLRGAAGSGLRRRAETGEDDRIRRALAMIAEQYARPALTTAQLAQAAGLSPSTFFERFRELTGLTPQRYIKRARLQKARELLQAGDTAAAAGAAVGYLSPAHFSRDYSRQYGSSPRRHVRELVGA
jgi:AraC-like DNA-binding protein